MPKPHSVPSGPSGSSGSPASPLPRCWAVTLETAPPRRTTNTTSRTTLDCRVEARERGWCRCAMSCPEKVDDETRCSSTDSYGALSEPRGRTPAARKGSRKTTGATMESAMLGQASTGNEQGRQIVAASDDSHHYLPGGRADGAAADEGFPMMTGRPQRDRPMHLHQRPSIPPCLPLACIGT